MDSITPANQFEVRLNPSAASDDERVAAMAAPAFGEVFTDHMARATWTQSEGWGDRRIEPLSDLALHPGATILHYGQQAFEGLKAYVHEDRSVWLFRPEANAARLAASAARMALPAVSEEDFLAAIEALVATDRAWVPSAAESSLYLRPLLIGTEPTLSVRGSQQVEFLVMACPVGAYFPNGVKPVSIWVAQGFHRAGPGGTGTAKSAGNYAASLLPQQQAQDNNCQQVLFLDAREDRYIEELGGMNVFIVHRDGSVLTPRLTGTILEGVTRSSVITLLKESGREVSERDVTLEELRAGIDSGDISEVFACGTAAVVTPLGSLKSPDFNVVVGDGSAGDVTMGVREALTDIYYGRAEDTHGWMRRIG
ncbi:branched-chain amino acid aminotransferase [Demequina aurantiaca]|uniref:branched-chain amino acid aminotransferase n=1 Tax=Demequina aurantiaca TaxID=676200 RepID=UPI000780A9C3|nr:branched-chain amino acid aminotransferase [Demequina aurantiaca]